MSLEREIAWFEQNRWLWFHQAENRWALVKGEMIFGFYVLWTEAYYAGVRQLGVGEDFLVKQVLLQDRTYFIL